MPRTSSRERYVELPNARRPAADQPERLAPAVALVARAEHEPRFLEPAEQPRQVGSVEREVAGEVDRGERRRGWAAEEDAGLRSGNGWPCRSPAAPTHWVYQR
jgi:hypothetical protein